jgi:hypothetical protein
MKRRTLLVAGGTLLCLVVAGYGVTTYAKSDTMSAPVKMTNEQLDQLNSETQFIHTSDGLFERTDKDIQVQPEEVAYDSSKVTNKTKKLVLPYGTFVKTKSFKNGQESQ